MGRSIPLLTRAMAVAFLAPSFLVGTALVNAVVAADPAPVAVNQGPEWTPARRDEFYSLDQGSRIIPLRWIMALKLPDGSPFMADSLRRYGFLPNDASATKLPVGFNAAGQTGSEMIGMTCAACHTRQIEVAGTAYRIDGGPAITDFQKLLSDLDTAVDTLLNDGTSFASFAIAVLGNTHTPADETALRLAVSNWYYRYHAQMEKALPAKKPWGTGRLDAIAMIFDRLTGLDVGPAPGHLIRENIRAAVAPVRYPFLWNAFKQDMTQWPGFAPNTDTLLRLARNLGQVYGVFAEFAPERDPSSSSGDGINYLAGNSANFGGLKALDILTTYIGPPRWPWALDTVLVSRGEVIFERECMACHGSEKNPVPWKTPIVPITELKSDYAELELLSRPALSGSLEGSTMVFEGGPLKKEDTALRILTASVIGSIVQDQKRTTQDLRIDTNTAKVRLRGIFTTTTEPGYEARVLQGVWAAAPYLHNGSVPTLTELLKPAAERSPSFKIGSAYDPDAVGLAVDQTEPNSTLTTTDCNDRGSGNSRCGHEYGTKLIPDEKRALLEYLKSL